MTREDYDRYAEAFNARDYDAVFDFYAEKPDLAFFGVNIRTRQQLRDFYAFLHSFVRETIRVGKFAASEEMAAVEGVIRVEAFRELTREALDAQGLHQFFPIAAGEVQEMRQFIHYHLVGGKISSVGCAIVP
jgi:hypothetical protein